MNDYKQPSFYRFNEDSVELLKYVSTRVKHAERILDLGAGSGILGIELSNILKARELTLVDVQPEWLDYQEWNMKNLLKDTKGEAVVMSFKDWMPFKKYDLIVSNPPYYLPGHGQPSVDKKREIARSFVIDGWEELLLAIERSLTSEGKAFLVVKDDKRILEKIRGHTLQNQGNLVFIEIVNKLK